MPHLDATRCRFCGDVATVDPDTWEASGECIACQAPAVQAGHVRRTSKGWDPVLPDTWGQRASVATRTELIRPRSTPRA